MYGSMRENRQGIKAARFIVKQLEKRNHTVTFLDAKELELPILEKMHKSYDKAPQKLENIHNTLEKAEAFVVVSGEYNHSIPPGLKNLLDHFQKEYFFKPCGIVTYSAGPFGGVRVGVHLRAILGELGMVTPSTMFPISKVQDAFDDEGKDQTGNYERRIKQFLDELEWYCEALSEQRKKGLPF